VLFGHLYVAVMQIINHHHFHNFNRIRMMMIGSQGISSLEEQCHRQTFYSTFRWFLTTIYFPIYCTSHTQFIKHEEWSATDQISHECLYLPTLISIWTLIFTDYILVQEDVSVVNHWLVSGTHYARTRYILPKVESIYPQ